ncbi:TPA: 30S ribosomal protein S4 [Candidatus Gracilibacteria bacterium]|nr:30S ribosomal protein S4 [Candidatus Peregrinibacteria bacterium]HIQ56993.1 30S ribosomal protein S4 [Candidatus Gracilibacteria bacterium]HIQ57424.1 30S ribosomal protein S4 [Candidatus Gracilibacteria bacterium]
MRYTGSKNKLARREGVDLGLKSKPVDTSRAVGPHGGARRGKLSEFGTQLRAKQTAKRIYGLSEKQFRNLFEKAANGRHPTGVTFVTSLERRFDNIIYRSGFAVTRAQARQMVNHRAFLVNGIRMDIPSYQAKAGDVITVREKTLDHPVLRSMESVKTKAPSWLSVNIKNRTIEVTRLPEEADAEQLVNVQSIIEFYSR